MMPAKRKSSKLSEIDEERLRMAAEIDRAEIEWLRERELGLLRKLEVEVDRRPKMSDNET